jgi:hypothetical protein
MTPTMRRWSLVAASVVVLALALLAWRIEMRTRPDAVGPRFVEALIDRHPGATVDGWQGGILHVALPSGLYVDVHLSTVFDACRAHRFDCSDAIDHAVGDVDRVEASTGAPKADHLQPMVLGEPGLLFGFITEPLIGTFEIRYALVEGVASIFVTGAIADRLGLSKSALRTTAFANLHAESPIEPVTISLPNEALVLDVKAQVDPVALLLDHERMRRLATRLGASRVYAAIPTRGTLLLAKADDAGQKALATRMPASRANVAGVGGIDMLVYDVDAEDDAALSIAKNIQ